MATVRPVEVDTLCSDPGCDEILRASHSARFYRAAAYCLDGHERTPDVAVQASPDTWLSDRLDQVIDQLDRIAAALEYIASPASPD